MFVFVLVFVFVKVDLVVRVVEEGAAENAKQDVSVRIVVVTTIASIIIIISVSVSGVGRLDLKERNCDMTMEEIATNSELIN